MKTLRTSADALLRSRAVPVIGLTGNAMDGDRERCLQAGMCDYITKPVRSQDLARALERWTGTAG